MSEEVFALLDIEQCAPSACRQGVARPNPKPDASHTGITVESAWVWLRKVIGYKPVQQCPSHLPSNYTGRNCGRVVHFIQHKYCYKSKRSFGYIKLPTLLKSVNLSSYVSTSSGMGLIYEVYAQYILTLERKMENYKVQQQFHELCHVNQVENTWLRKC
ncbi:uncharacterized protein LOC120358515 [Solenopsis invicta]|uniref:uncharacterized protein LOC120358515 n=1 Tax=Solenopsis invicta TaxID=13686 RepID=UPI00193D69B1|nr:uncharacterized protein LOC120358515 [Solenopsis invicta]